MRSDLQVMYKLSLTVAVAGKNNSTNLLRQLNSYIFAGE